MFEDIEQFEERGSATDEFLLQMRLNYNLPLPEMLLEEEYEKEVNADLCEIECFKLIEGEEEIVSFQDDEAEYLLENDETEAEMETEITENEEESQESSQEVQLEKVTDDEVVRFEDEEMIFHEETVDADEIIDRKSEEDDMLKHFE